MKTKKLLSILAILFIALISGCASDDYNEVVGVCPVVSLTIPADGSFGVPLNQIISVSFNEEMNPSTINTSSIIISVAGVEVPGTVTYSGTTAVFTPSSRLTTNTLYTGTVKTSVKDVAGNALQTDYVWTFTTGLNPLVVSTDPVNLAIDVALNKVITATFNMSMDPLTLNATTFIVKQEATVIAGTITYAGTKVTFTPAILLDENKVYTCTITKGAANTIGTELASDYIWTFTTGLAPRVISTDPASNATGVVLNKVISATFNMPMNPLTLSTATFTVKQSALPIFGVISYTGSTVTFTPNAPLIGGEVYTCTISTNAQNTAGTSLANNYVWTFTTGLVPIVTSTDPVNNATGVLLNKVIKATFNIPMNPSTLTATTYTVKQEATTVPGTISYNGTTVSFTPNTPLEGNKLYTCTITTGAQSLNGTSLSSNYIWTFTTGAVPIVIATDPVNNATGVLLNKVIKATFNIPMNPSTLTATTYTVKQEATTVPGTISYTGTTVSFTPNTPLEGNKLYTCTITTGAQSLNGTSLSSNYIWTFTTVVPVVIPPVAGLFFGVFGGNAGITNQGLFTVVNGAIGTIAASSLITGFRDGLSGDVYTVTPLNNGLVTDGIYTDAPPPGNATKAATALAGLKAAKDLHDSISPASMPGGVSNPGAGELGGLTLAPGIYAASSSFKITDGNLVLDAKGDSNAKWYFQAPSSLTVGDAQPSSVTFLGGVGNPANVYWYVGSSAVINYAGGGTMIGNIIARAGVTLSSPANSTNSSVTTLNGRAISLEASVTMVNTVINVPN